MTTKFEIITCLIKHGAKPTKKTEKFLDQKIDRTSTQVRALNPNFGEISVVGRAYDYTPFQAYQIVDHLRQLTENEEDLEPAWKLIQSGCTTEVLKAASLDLLHRKSK